jgi:hypothetical protein
MVRRAINRPAGSGFSAPRLFLLAFLVVSCASYPAAATSGCGLSTPHADLEPTDGESGPSYGARGGVDVHTSCCSISRHGIPRESSPRADHETVSCGCGCSDFEISCPWVNTSSSAGVVLCTHPCPCAGQHSQGVLSSPRLPTGLTPSLHTFIRTPHYENLATLCFIRTSQHTPAVLHGPPRESR